MDFPSRGDVSKDKDFYEMEEENGAPNLMVETKESNPLAPIESGSDILSSNLPSNEESSVLQLRRSQRGNIPRRHFEIEGNAFMADTQDHDEPRSYREAISSTSSEKWKVAMDEEMESMKTNQVWDLVDLPTGRKAVGNKWVLKVKCKSDGSIERYKARLVAKGYTQQEGIDYEETFSLVVRFASIRFLLAIVAYLDLELYQMDVKTAFLNGELAEEIYMEQPEGYIEKGFERKVCKLKRSIYGLKQASRQWYLRFHRAVIDDGFTMIKEDHCVYLKRSNGKFLILSMYVDDILLAGNDKGMIVATKRWLSSNFEMKDMGEAAYVLGVKIFRDRSRKLLGLSQETYLKKVLELFQMNNCKPIDTPVAKGDAIGPEHCPTSPEEIEKMSHVPYATAIGKLMYAVQCTRPDIEFAVHVLGRYQSNPGIAHWKAIKRILRYLRGTLDYMLCYGGSDFHLVGYSDASYGGDRGNQRSTSGYAFLLNGGAITWLSKKQTCVTLSTMESEFVACTSTVQEALWLRRFFKDLIFVPHASDPVTVFCDSTSALDFIKDPKYHGRTKHIDLRTCFIRENIANNEVVLKYIPTDQMIADPLTKPIPRDAFQRHVRSLGLRRV